MKRLLLLAILSMAAVLICAPAASAQDEMTVSIQDFFFDPGQLSVAPGTTVTWVNEGRAPHTVTSTDGKELDSATLQPGDTYTFTFDEGDAGETYAYQCTIHPQMTASVTVSGGAEMTTPSAVPRRAHPQVPPRAHLRAHPTVHRRVLRRAWRRGCPTPVGFPASSGGCGAVGSGYSCPDRQATRHVTSRYTWLRGSLRPSARETMLGDVEHDRLSLSFCTSPGQPTFPGPHALLGGSRGQQAHHHEGDEARQHPPDYGGVREEPVHDHEDHHNYAARGHGR